MGHIPFHTFVSRLILLSSRLDVAFLFSIAQLNSLFLLIRKKLLLQNARNYKRNKIYHIIT